MNKEQTAKSRNQAVARILAVAVFAVFWIALATPVARQARQHDFLNIYTGASLALEGRFADLHSSAVQLERERSLVPSTGELVPFVRPHVYALALAPLALIPFGTAFWVWIGLQAALYSGFGWWAQRTFGGDTIIWWALYLPGAVGIAHGQDGAILLAALAAGFVSYKRGDGLLAGLLWSLMLVKFHLCIGLAVALVAARLWRPLAGFVSGGAVLALASFALGGWEGARNYVSLLTDPTLARLSPAPAKMVSFEGLAANLSFGGGPVLVFGAIIALALTVFATWRAPLWLALAAGMAGGLFAAPHVYVYDLTALLLPLLLVLNNVSEGPARWAAAFLLAPLATLLVLFQPPWCAAGALALALFLVSLVLLKTRLGETIQGAQPVQEA